MEDLEIQRLRGPSRNSERYDVVKKGGFLVLDGKSLRTEQSTSSLLIVGSNSVTAKGLVGQLHGLSSLRPDSAFQRKQYDRVLEGLFDLGDRRSTMVWMGGLSLQSTSILEQWQEIEMTKIYAEGQLREVDIVQPENLTIDWAPNDQSIDLELTPYISLLKIFSEPTYLHASTTNAHYGQHLPDIAPRIHNPNRF